MKFSVFLAFGLAGLPLNSVVFAEPLKISSGLDNVPWLSARAAGLSQTLSTSANGLDSYYYNPALIGGVQEKAEKPFITHLFFPFIGSSGGDGGSSILTDHLTGESLASDALADRLTPESPTARPYSRLSLTPVAIFERLMIGYTYSTRISSHQNNDDPALPTVHVEERTLSGPFLGFSAIAPKDEFYMGVSAAYLKSEETLADWDLSTATTETSRKEALKAGRITYEGMPINVGMLYRFTPSYKPSISLVVNDVGSTRYSPSDKTQTSLVEKESATLGFGIAPPIKTLGTLHLTAEATELTDSEVPTRDKFRLSSEFTMGARYAADAGLSVRLGYSSAGISYGAGMNLGILNLQIASYAEDIGAKSARVIERRSVINIGINIADY